MNTVSEKAMSGNAFRLLCLLLLILFVSCGGDNGVTPPAMNKVLVTSVTPNTLAIGGQGLTLEVTGSGFVSVTAVDLGEGIAVVSKDVADSAHINLVVNVFKTASPGPRTVIVSTAAASGQLAAGLTISSDHAPIPKIVVSPSEGTIASVFTFDAGSSVDPDGAIKSYKWQISDGTELTGKTVHHEFSEKGVYTIRLTITDDKAGASSTEKEITVGDNLPPTASFTTTPSSGSNLTIFAFDASASSDPDGSIKRYHWVFGDNAEENGVKVTHKYAKAGDYRVELHVTDSKNAETVAAKQVSVIFFDADKARQEITDTLTDFLRMFGDFEHLSAQEICVGFSKSSECLGREREINIIEKKQQEISSEGVGSISVEVTQLDEHSAHANVRAEFYGVTNDGQSYDGFNTHHFTMVNEDGTWLMCNFYLTAD